MTDTSKRAYWRSVQLGERREVEVPGGRIRVFERGQGPPIVFAHGVIANANLWRKVVPALSGEHRCLTLDLPLGAHELAMQKDADLGAEAMVAIIVAALDALELERPILAGCDTGGALTQMVAARHLERLGGIVLTSCDAFEHFPPPLFAYLKTVAYLPTSVTPLLFAPMRSRAIRRLPIAYGWLAKRAIDRDAEDSYVLPSLTSGAVRRDLKKAIRVFDSRQTLEAASLLPAFERPALIAWSREDRVFPPRDAERLAACLPDTRVEWIDDSYTFSPEDQPGRLAELIAEFANAPAEAAA